VDASIDPTHPRVRVDRPRILVVIHLGRGRSALANGHGDEAPRGSVDSG
jgi:hypothetical protein